MLRFVNKSLLNLISKLLLNQSLLLLYKFKKNLDRNNVFHGIILL
jgi:hypothetical protein